MEEEKRAEKKEYLELESGELVDLTKQKEAEYIFAKEHLDHYVSERPWNEDLYSALKDGYLQGKVSFESFERYVKEHPERTSGNGSLRTAFYLIRDTLGYYLDMPEDKKTIVALWIIGTYFHHEFESYPHLFFNAMRGSGKTRTVKLATRLSKDGEMLMSLTEAGLYRTNGTLGIDEFENLGSKDKQALRELLNASYKKGIKIVRMKKKKSMQGEEMVAEYFEPYRPIVMANIWGIEEVLGDRCITIILEKSSRQNFTKLVENFEKDQKINEILQILKNQCSLCSVVTKKNIDIYTKWNAFIKNKYTLYTLHTYTTLNTITTFEEEDFFEKVNETNIDGRNLELYLPLFLIANDIGEDVLYETLEIAKSNIELKKIDDITESKDVSMFSFVSKQQPNIYYKIKELTNSFMFVLGEGESNRDWLNTKWMGRALKRLNLIVDRRRVSDGIEVTLNVEKAKEKLEMFK